MNDEQNAIEVGSWVYHEAVTRALRLVDNAFEAMTEAGRIAEEFNLTPPERFGPTTVADELAIARQKLAVAWAALRIMRNERDERDR